jgi:hypothetical protein
LLSLREICFLAKQQSLQSRKAICFCILGVSLASWRETIAPEKGSFHFPYYAIAQLRRLHAWYSEPAVHKALLPVAVCLVFSPCKTIKNFYGYNKHAGH